VLENDIRRLLAYHIISQVGYMVAAVGVGTAMAINGAAAHAFAHVLYKGLLFMGAYHRVLDYLPADIAVERVKEPEKVRAYFQQLLKKGADTELERLARYLVSPPGRAGSSPGQGSPSHFTLPLQGEDEEEPGPEVV